MQTNSADHFESPWHRAARKGEEGARGARVRSMKVRAQESKRGKEGNPQAREKEAGQKRRRETVLD